MNTPHGWARQRHPATVQSADLWWDYAHGCAQALLHGLPPPEHAVYGPLLEPGEVVRLYAPATYSRLQPGRTRYRPAAAPIVAYNPIMMLGSYAAQSIINSRLERRAARDQELDWRLQRPTTVLTTSDRIMCERPDGAWISFWYQDFSDYHPDLATRTLTIAFTEGQCAPLRLTGPATPAITLWSAIAAYGSHWKDDPRLDALLTPLRAQRQQRNIDRVVHTPEAGVDRSNPITEMVRRVDHPDAYAHRWAYQHVDRSRVAHQTRAQSKDGGRLTL